MKFETKSLRSKVSKRIFALFMLSAFIPIFTIYLISYNQISEQLEKETERQIYRESRSLGLTVYDRLLSLETNLKIVAIELERGMQPELFTQDDWLHSIFSSIHVMNDLGTQYRVLGSGISPGTFNEGQKKHLDSGNTLLLFSPQENQQPAYFLIRQIQRENRNREYLVARIQNQNFWNFAVYSPEFVCVMDHMGFTHYCSMPLKNEEKLNLSAQINSAKTNFTYWSFNGQEYAVNSWGIFLKARFFAEDFSLVMAVPVKSAFFTFADFRSTFPKVLITAGLLIALLSIIQIRKTFTPLQKLMEGTSRISQRQFDKPVEIKSGDEFENLANSFNEMAKRLDEQFKTISTLAEIDRLILSSLDTDYIIDTLIGYLHNVVTATHVCVIKIDDNDKNMAVLYINIDPGFEQIDRQKLRLTDEELKELNGCKNYFQIDANEDKGYTRQLRVVGDKSFLIFPVHIKEQLSGLICLGSGDQFNITEYKLRQIRELSDRVAVALSNAAWEEQLYQQAHYDSLTGLPNRFLFKDRLEQALEQANRNNSYIAVLFVDLDHFKNINDSLGHNTGDSLLTQVAQIMAKCMRRYDSIARLGGDEYAIFISDVKKLEKVIIKAEQLSDRILKALENPILLDQREVYITPSIGISIYPKDAKDYDELLKTADSAMYSAKARGRNNYQFYNREHSLVVLEKLELQTELRHALEREELTLFYQPKINCKTGQVVGAEALLRWQHPVKGLIYPGNFIPGAEETGVVVSVGNWVLDKACVEHKMLLNQGIKDATIAINISSEQFKEANIFNTIQDALENAGLPPNNLELEITESIAIEDFERTIDVLHRLKRLGVNISIDDFGTGYSSLTYLQKFPIDKLKIDRSFISKIPEDKNSISIITSIIALAHSLDLAVIAEGVETQEQCELLLQLDCDEIQGYVITQPLSAENFRLFMLRENAVSIP